MTIARIILTLLSIGQVEATSAPPLEDRPTLIVVVGAPGEAEFGSAFNAWADRWASAAQGHAKKIVQIGRDSSDGSEDKSKLQALIAEESKQIDGGPLWIVLIGHGTFDSREAKFNLRGPDMSDQELTTWLEKSVRPLAVINCASGSSPFLNKLSSKERIVITATRAGSEIQFARFGDFLSSAISDPSADLDKDGQTSLLEAYLAASHRTEDFYKTEGRLATEHALLDDNGDKLGTPADFFEGYRATKSARNNAPLDGTRAHQWHLVRSATEQQMSPELRAKRDQIETSIEALRRKKGTLPEDEYYRQLEALLVELARLYQSATPT